MTTKIEWVARPGTVPETWNLVGGCTKKSPGCANCYAIRQSWMKMHHPNPKVRELYEGTVHKVNGKLEWTGRINLASSERLEKPLRWRKPRTVFVCSMGDLFHEDVPFAEIWEVWKVMRGCPQHTFQVLTKRPERMAEDVPMFYCAGERPLSNVWGMVSVENQAAADERIPLLLQTPFAVRGVSCEPLLGAIFFAKDAWSISDGFMPGWLKTEHNQNGLDWVIAGGESGPGARPMNSDWARGVRDQCQAAGVPFFFKQWGAWLPYDHDPESPEYGIPPDYYTDPDAGYLWRKVGKKAAGRLLDGREWNEWPK